MVVKIKNHHIMKSHLLIVLLVVSIYACDKKTEVEPSTPHTQNEINIALTKQYFEHFNAHEWQKMAAMYSETAAFKDPSLGDTIVTQTRAQTIAKYSELEVLFPDLHDEVLRVYPSGAHHVIVEFISTGTAPDASVFKLPICTIFTFKDEKIIKDFTYYDNFDTVE